MSTAMANPAITYDELKAALEEDSCARITEPALFALLDKLDQAPSLFGRWATHPEHGRGIIISRKPDSDGKLWFAYRTSRYTDHANTRFVRPESLTIDPATLTAAQDFDKAPVGTIVEAPMYPKDVAVKTEDGWYRTGGMHAIAVEYMPTCRVIRWGENK